MTLQAATNFLKGFLLGVFLTIIIYAIASINFVYVLLKAGIL
jgi:hypothetical protein